MLLPAQQAAGMAATNLMQSVLDSVEQRRADEEEKAKGKKEDPVLKAKISSDAAMQRAREKIDAYLFDSSYVSPNELKMQLIDRLGKAMGLEKLDGESGFGYGKKLESMLADMDYAQKRKIEKDTGLADLGISIETMVGAIKNPYGDENEQLQAALEKQAGGGKENKASQSKALQRLESIANPKTAEELRLEPSQNDPTRIEDAETRQERRQDISDKQAMQKLDDIAELQHTIKDHRDQAAKAADKGETAGSDPLTADSMQLIQVLAAGADAAKAHDEPSDATQDSGNTSKSKTDATRDAVKSAQAQSGIDPSDEPDVEAGDQRDKPILTIHVDEIGIYDLLKQKKAA